MMNKRKLLITLIVFALIAFGVTGIVSAQGPTPRPNYPPGSGSMMGGGNNGNYGMMGGEYGNDYGMMGSGYGSDYGMMGYGAGYMHDYMVTALAELLGLTPDALDEQLSAGFSMWDIARDQGYSDTEIVDLMAQAHTAALEQAVADGVLSQEQADWMNEHMSVMDGYMLQLHENSFGDCHDGKWGGPAASGMSSWWRMIR